MKQHTTFITLADCDLKVKFTHYPASRGSRDKYGCPMEPDEPESFEIEEVWLLAKQDTDITDLLSIGFDDIEEAVRSNYADAEMD